MKLLLPFFGLFLLLFQGTLQAQQQYTVDGKTYTLNTEVEGSLTLLWNTIDEEYRYFSKKGEEIVELKNTKQNGNFQEEYKQTLMQHTADANIPTEKVNLTLPSLRAFFMAYNKIKDPNYGGDETSIDLQFRLGAFAGISNSAYTSNPTNALQAVGGIDFELIDGVKLKRHALVLRFKQTFESNEYSYSASQLSLNYRFKFVKSSKFDAFINCKFAALTYSKIEVMYLLESDPPVLITENSSGTDFGAPFTFGIGMDYKVGNGYITFNYNDIAGLNVETNDEFPVDFTLGYKFNL